MTDRLPRDEIAEFEARIDPELLDAVRRKIGVDLTDIARAREFFRAARVAANQVKPLDPHVQVEERVIPALSDRAQVTVRLLYPTGRPEGAPGLIWVHGGGHVVGDAESDDPLVAEFVKSLGCVVVSVEWRRSPEHPFPAAINDCYAALHWAYIQNASLGIDPARIAVGGASSGGGSAAGLALLARDRGEIPICYQLLTYPMLDDRDVTHSAHAVTHPRLWNRATNRLAWQAYLGVAASGEPVSPYAAPTRATNLTGLPPAFIGVGELDLFLDEDIEYAQRLLGAGVPTELHVYPGAVHGFEGLAPGSDVAQRFARDRMDALRRAFDAGHATS